MTDETLTQQVVDDANKLLSVLVSQAKGNWQKAMEETLEKPEQETNTANVNRKLKKFGIDEPVGAIAASTVAMKKEAGLEGEQGQQAVQALKSEGRLHQCGRGRGKCLIVLSAEPLSLSQPEPEPVSEGEVKREEVAAPSSDGQEEAHESEVDLIRADDVTGLTRAMRDGHRTMSRRINELTRQNKMLEKQNNTYEQQLDEQNRIIADLESQLEQRKVGSWA